MPRTAGPQSAQLASAPGSRGFVVTPNDGADLARETVGLWVGGTGTLTVVLAGDAAGVTTLFSGIPAGTWLPLAVKRVMATGTSATLIVAVTQ